MGQNNIQPEGRAKLPWVPIFHTCDLYATAAKFGRVAKLAKT